MTFEVFNPCTEKTSYKKINTIKELMDMCQKYHCSLVISPWAEVSNNPNVGSIIIYNTYLE